MDYTVPGPPLYSGASTEGSATPAPSNGTSSSNSTSAATPASSNGANSNAVSASGSIFGEIGNQDNVEGCESPPALVPMAVADVNSCSDRDTRRSVSELESQKEREAACTRHHCMIALL